MTLTVSELHRLLQEEVDAGRGDCNVEARNAAGDFDELNKQNVFVKWDRRAQNFVFILDPSVKSMQITNQRNFARITLAPESLAALLTSGSYTVDSKIPADAKFAGAWFDPLKGCFICHFEHPSFDPIFPGSVLPDLGDVIITRNS